MIVSSTNGAPPKKYACASFCSPYFPIGIRESRGIDTIVTLPFAGSTLATMIVSDLVLSSQSVASIPKTSTFIGSLDSIFLGLS